MTPIQMFKVLWENPQFRKDIKTSLEIFGFGVLLFTYGSIKGCCVEKKAETESVQKNNVINTKNTFDATQLFRKSNIGLQR